MKVALAQIDPVIGAFEANVRKIKEAYKRACSKRARLLLTPELGLCGYPPHDLVDRPEMVERCESALRDVMTSTKAQSTALAVGHVAASSNEFGKASQNVVSIIEDGRLVFRQAKTLLPTYDVFDEARYFEPAEEIKLWNCDGTSVAVAICEDLWGNDPTFGRKLYGNDPVSQYREQRAKLVVSLSASPFIRGKRERREALHIDVAKSLGAPLIYLNQVGATDEILFDGGSFAVSGQGRFLGRLPFFKTSFGIVDLEKGCEFESPTAEGREDQDPLEIDLLYRALVCGIREYFHRTGFKKAILGLSGGIDSAVVATLAVQALGAENVLGVAMPSQYSSGHALADAEALARNLNIGFEVRPIKFLFSTSSRELGEKRGTLAPLALENLQSRLRGITLMTLSNHDHSLVLTTGNKSELATGYCTLYGDMCGALAPLGDVLKVQVYELARYMNQILGGPIPQSSITKAPSAELRPDQKDQDTLPPYEFLDAVLSSYLEEGKPIADIRGEFAKTPQQDNQIMDVLKRLEINEYKRRQAAPVLKVSNKAFGIGRRVPIAKQWI